MPPKSTWFEPKLADGLVEALAACADWLEHGPSDVARGLGWVAAHQP